MGYWGPTINSAVLDLWTTTVSYRAPAELLPFGHSSLIWAHILTIATTCRIIFCFISLMELDWRKRREFPPKCWAAQCCQPKLYVFDIFSSFIQQNNTLSATEQYSLFYKSLLIYKPFYVSLQKHSPFYPSLLIYIYSPFYQPLYKYKPFYLPLLMYSPFYEPLYKY